MMTPETAMPADRPLGPLVEGWTPPPVPPRDLSLEGAHVRLRPLRAATDARPLFDAYAGADGDWTYLPVGPYAAFEPFADWCAGAEASVDPQFLTIETEAGIVGSCSYLRINPGAGSIEVGFIHYAPALQGAPAATEAMHLMMAWAFDAGYRRYEWKCDALNAPSRRAAQRLGFSYEGTHRQALIVKGRNRDTAWFSILDSEWPALREAHQDWLSPENFDAQGRQIRALSALTRPLLAAVDPGL